MFLTRWQEKFNNGDLDIFKSDRATCLFYQFLYFSSSNLKHFKPQPKCWGCPAPLPLEAGVVTPRPSICPLSQVPVRFSRRHGLL